MSSNLLLKVGFLFFLTIPELSAESDHIFVAPAEQRLIKTLSRIEYPDQLADLQRENELKVEASSWIYTVLLRPVKIPEHISNKFAEELKKIGPLKPLDPEEPMMGPERIFISFDTKGNALSVTELGWFHNRITIKKCLTCGLVREMANDSFPPMNQKGVTSSIGDLFQVEDDKEAVFYSEEAANFLRTIPAPAKNGRTPFRQWTLETNRNLKSFREQREIQNRN